MKRVCPFKRSRRFTLLSLVLPFAAPIAVVIIGYAMQTSQEGIAHPIPGPMQGNGQLEYTGPLGSPAIKPRTDLASSAGPHVTEADVRQYLQTSMIPDLAPGAARPVIVSIQFTTAKTIRLQFGGIDVPDSKPLCLVRLTGTFINSHVLAPGEAPQVLHQEKLVFDGYTGNLLLVNLNNYWLSASTRPAVRPTPARRLA